MSLFGTSSRPKNLVEFIAGKMNKEGKLVSPDNRRGQVYLYSSDDGLLHFCWKDRKTNIVEDDLIIFPGDVDFVHLPQCTTGRVYVLKFLSSPCRLFFWLQSLDTSKDEEIIKKVRNILSSSKPHEEEDSNSMIPKIDPLALNMLSDAEQKQIFELLGLDNPKTTKKSRDSTDMQKLITPDNYKPRTIISAPSRKPLIKPDKSSLNELNSFLIEKNVDLSQIVNTTTFNQYLVISKDSVDLLSSHLPDVDGVKDNVIQTLNSPIFKSALSEFSGAFHGCYLGPVMKQFGLNDDICNAALSGDFESFAKHLEEMFKQTTDENME